MLCILTTLSGFPAVFMSHRLWDGYLGGYVSPRDLTQLFVKAVETPSIENEHGVPWQVVYAVSNNKRAFWSVASARRVLGYQPEDDSEVKFADDIRRLGLEDATSLLDVFD